jgi:hypothetical protein
MPAHGRRTCTATSSGVLKGARPLSTARRWPQRTHACARQYGRDLTTCERASVRVASATTRLADEQTSQRACRQPACTSLTRLACQWEGRTPFPQPPARHRQRRSRHRPHTRPRPAGLPRGCNAASTSSDHRCRAALRSRAAAEEGRAAELKRGLRASGDDMAPSTAAMPPQEGGRRAVLGRRTRSRPRTAAALAAAEKAARPPHRKLPCSSCEESAALQKGYMGSTPRPATRVEQSSQEGLYVAVLACGCSQSLYYALLTAWSYGRED